MRDYVLWLGSIYDEHEIQSHAAVSPAASHWQTRLIDAVKRTGLDVVLVAHPHRRIWPRGPLYVAEGNRGRSGQVWCGYANLPGIKSASIAVAMRRKVRRFVRHRMSLKAVVSYNPTPENVAVGRFVQKRYGVPWIDLCADAYSPGDGWISYPRGAEYATGHVFLSHGAFVDCPFPKKLHLDGGIDIVESRLPRKKEGERTTLLYTGMLGPWGGVDILLGAMARSEDSNLRLQICGHGRPSDRLLASVAGDPRIHFLGQVSETRVRELMLQADIFVNPRPAKIDGGEMNFPSKVLRYLAYGKPVVSTSTAGLAPEYADVLILVEPDSERALLDAITRVSSWTAEQHRRYQERARNFAVTSRSWSIQGQRLVSWIDGLR